MFCSKCGKEVPDDDPDLNFCPKCGNALKGAPCRTLSAQMRWEFKDLRIPLAVSVQLDGRRHDEEIQHGNETILRAIQHAAVDGWQPEGKTDWFSLQNSMEKHTRDQGFWNPRSTIVYEAVTIRLKRLVQD